MSTNFLETADRIGSRLCRDAIWAGDRCNWIGGYNESGSMLVHRALGPDVYGGTSGIALVLFHLFQETGEKVFRMTAEGALRQALSREDHLREGRRFGFFDGLSGIAWVAHTTARITGNEAHSRTAIRLAHDLPAASSRLDIINGSAGAIGVLLQLYHESGDALLLESARHHGQVLVDAANRGDAGWSWKTIATSPRDLTGFAHGAAGICWALLEIFQATGEGKFRDAALEGFRFERSVFDPEEQGWPDFRYPPQALPDGKERHSYAVMWCHGAPGIGFSRLRAWQILGESVYREEAEAAILTTARWLQNGSSGNYSLCHGRAGNSELLSYAGRVLQNSEHLALTHRVAEAGVEQYENDRVPWPCGVTDGDETPDLMLGLAGIAYFYLRLHEPARCPPVLLLVTE
jgi:type 2 lantibiotic biosynthesis protein LanM